MAWWLAPAAAGLRPGRQVVDRAESVRHPVLSPMADEKHVGLGELGTALGANLHRLVERRGLGHRPRVPMGALDRPGNHVFEPAERRPALARRFVGAEAVVRLDRRPTPGARLSHL
jgi:hypothetical protein